MRELFMNDFRDEYGLPPKPTRRCEVYGVETHANKRRKKHDPNVVKAYQIIKLFCKYIDEARKIK